MLTIKQKIIGELEKQWFPDLDFLFSNEVLDISLELLNELLEIDKQKFEELLKIENKDLSFDTFEDESNLDYFWSLLNHLQNIENTEKIRKIIEEFRPILQDFWNYVAYTKSYFHKLVYVEKNIVLDDDQKRILYLRIKAFKDRWIDLNSKQQDRLKELNKELSKLSDSFSNNIVDSEGEFEYLIENREVIKDLPEEILDATKKIAEKKWKKWYLFDADPTSYQAIMKYCSDSKIRADFAVANYSFASSWKYDNRENILNILKLKKEKSDILWYKNFSELSLNSKMADSPEQVFDLIETISEKANAKATKELKKLKTYFNLEKLNSEDISYYSRIYKEEKYDIDDKELKKYFCLDNTISYLHNFVNKFYWIELIPLSQPFPPREKGAKQNEVSSLPWGETERGMQDIRIYEVYKDWKLISYYFLDLFYRKLKRPWAWADNLREKTYLWNTKLPIVVNVCNFAKTDWKITISPRDTETLFHEFGHAIHEMLSVSKYSELSWFWVEWDFVELPSQILENWVGDRNSLSLLAKHIDTWESLSDEMLDKLDKLKTYNSWIFVSRQNEFALLDMSIHCSPVSDNIEQLDKKVLEIVNKYSIFKRWDDYKMYCSFGHIFGWWYAAGYYSYMWAEIIEADVFARIKEMWMFDRSTWDKFIKTILWQGTRKKATELFFDFMWREVDNTAFMERKGL